MKQIKKVGVIMLAGLFVGSTAFALELNSGNIGNYCSKSDDTCELSNKGITDIAPGTFNEYADYLLFLDLNGNSLTKIKDNTFSGLENLEYLGLDNNSISIIENNAFSGLITLASLNLENNKLTGLNKNFWVDMPWLGGINLSGNLISDLNTLFLSKNENLKTLILSYNNISSIKQDAFLNSNNLRMLLLDHNKISTIESGAFNGLSKLESLNLVSNQIEDINISMFGGLSSDIDLYLDTNALKSLGSGLELTGEDTRTEIEKAFDFAVKNGITSAETLADFKLDTNITRRAVAKMIAQFAENVLGKEVSYSKNPSSGKNLCTNFSDTSSENAENKSYIQAACQLGLMGWSDLSKLQNSKSFSPNKNITRAQFATILSRLLRGTQYDQGYSKTNYYVGHSKALKDAGIIQDRMTPSKLETRGDILLLLYRAASQIE